MSFILLQYNFIRRDYYLGSAYLYRSFDGGETWSELSAFIASDAQNGDEYGAAVSMDYEIFAVGAPKDNTGQSDTGSFAGLIMDPL